MNRGEFIQFTTFRTIYNKGDEVGNIVFSFHGRETEKDNEEFETQYRARINGNHRAAPDDEGAVWIWNRFIDPAVFVDDDGRVYGYWGFGISHGAELDPATMCLSLIHIFTGAEVCINMP